MVKNLFEPLRSYSKLETETETELEPETDLGADFCSLLRLLVTAREVSPSSESVSRMSSSSPSSSTPKKEADSMAEPEAELKLAPETEANADPEVKAEAELKVRLEAGGQLSVGLPEIRGCCGECSGALP